MSEELNASVIEKNDIDIEKLIKAINLIDKYGIQPLFNYKEQILPASAYKGILPFSPSNYTEEPVPTYPKDHYINANRRPWSFEEREELIASTFGEALAHPCGVKIFIEKVREVDMIKFQSQVSHGFEEEWEIGKIIAMGTSAWDHLKYPMGAKATLNDYVVYNKSGTFVQKLREGVEVVIAEDWNVMVTVMCPIKLMEA